MMHTPGPWRVFHEGKTISVMEPNGRREVIHWMGFDASNFPKARLANAQLIAAAPDLLAACKAQHEAIDRLFAMLIVATRSDRPSESGMAFMPSKSSQPWDALVAGNAAIAKAEGA